MRSDTPFSARLEAVLRRTGGSFRRMLRDTSGNYAVIFAVSAPVLIGGMALGTEGGLWLYERHSVQNAADTAALSAATAYGANSQASLTTQATAIASGYSFGGNTPTVTVNMPPSSGTHTGSNKAVEVIVAISQPRLLTGLISRTPVTITGRAVALVGSPGNGCVLSLDPTASAAISAQGTTNVSLNNCSIYDNSNSSTGLSAGGSSAITALSASVVGGVTGAANFTTTNGITTGAPPVADPYASVAMPSYSGCNYNNDTEKNTVTLSPGVFCGGLQLNAGANVTLQPGVYIMNHGDLKISGGATLTGSGVTIVFTSSTGYSYAGATINGGAIVNLTAPTSGATKGIVFFGDRNAPLGTSFKFNGGSGQVVGGAVYVPRGNLQYAGGATATTQCTQLIGDTVTFTGNSVVAIDCAAYGTTPFGPTTASLVE